MFQHKKHVTFYQHNHVEYQPQCEICSTEGLYSGVQLTGGYNTHCPRTAAKGPWAGRPVLLHGQANNRLETECQRVQQAVSGRWGELASTQQHQDKAEHRYNIGCEIKSDMGVHCPAHKQHTVFSLGPRPCLTLYPII